MQVKKSKHFFFLNENFHVNILPYVDLLFEIWNVLCLKKKKVMSLINVKKILEKKKIYIYILKKKFMSQKVKKRFNPFGMSYV